MAVRALGDRGHREMVVGPPAILARFRMSSFGIRHGFSSFLPFVMQRGDPPLLRARNHSRLIPVPSEGRRGKSFRCALRALLLLE